MGVTATPTASRTGESLSGKRKETKINIVHITVQVISTYFGLIFKFVLRLILLYHLIYIRFFGLKESARDESLGSSIILPNPFTTVLVGS